MQQDWSTSLMMIEKSVKMMNKMLLDKDYDIDCFVDISSNINENLDKILLWVARAE